MCPTGAPWAEFSGPGSDDFCQSTKTGRLREHLISRRSTHSPRPMLRICVASTAGRKIKPSMKVDQPVASAVPPGCGPECCECVKGLLSARNGPEQLQQLREL